MKLSLKQKMAVLLTLILIVFFIATVAKHIALTKLENELKTYSSQAVQSKISVLEIEKNLNYVSRCTRDIMLGNSYDKNIEKLHHTTKNIEKYFDKLKTTFNAHEIQDNNIKQIENAKKSTLAFVTDGLSKVEALKNKKRTPDILHQTYLAYKKSATPLAEDSRKKFQEIIQSCDKNLKEKTLQFHNSVSTIKVSMIFESILLLTVISVLIIAFTRNILSSLKIFQNGLLEFFGFLNREIQTIAPIKITSKDEFGQMTSLINKNILKITKEIKEDRELSEEISDVLTKIKHGLFGYQIESQSSNPTMENIKILLNESITKINKDLDISIDILSKYANAHFDIAVNTSGVSGKTGSVILSIKALADSISELLAIIDLTANKLDHYIQILTSNTSSLSLASNRQATSLEETAAALEEITSTISNNTENTMQMSKYAQEVTTASKEGQILATRTVESMEDIDKQINLINDAISVIDKIAFQTNILSLNAAVEAATAGEAGKGFAVVAGEVRNLANRSTETANEIKALMENATQKADKGKETAHNMINGYKKLNDNITATISLIDQVSNASKEQREGIKQINNAITELDQTTQQNATTASQINELSQNIKVISEKLISTVAHSHYDSKAKEQICDLDMMFHLNKLKLDHINFKNTNFAKLRTKKYWEVTPDTQCTLGQWLEEQEKTNQQFTTNQNWKKLKNAHHKVHHQVQQLINTNTKGYQETNELCKLVLNTDKNISDVFQFIQQLKRDNCNSIKALDSKIV
jgi:methyl-accepting chemotaxis protein